MRTFTFLAIFCLVSFSMNAQNQNDKEAVKQVIVLFQNDFNNGLFDNASTYTTVDWEHINPSGGISKGRENVLKEVRKVHQSFLKGVSMQIESMEIRFLSHSVAMAEVVHSMDKYVSPDGNMHENEKQIKTYVLVQQKGKWLLAHDHNTIVSN